MTDLQEVLHRVGGVLRELGIPFALVGSIASSRHGIARSTRDIDLLVMLTDSQIGPLVERLRELQFYVDEEMARQAVSRGASFTVVYQPTIYKADLFVAASAFAEQQLERRVYDTLDGLRVPIASAEDTVVAKLNGYLLGGESSGQQWRDICGILAMQRDTLDFGYVRKWCEYFGLTDLLERALVSADTGE